MSSKIESYLLELQSLLNTGDAKEHAYRPAFEKFIKSIAPDFEVINEPAYTGGNAPDFLFKKGGVPIAYAECKDVTVELDNKEVQKQANRYVEAFGKILLTNYLSFRVIDEGGEVIAIDIAKIDNNCDIKPFTNNFDRLVNLLNDYLTPTTRSIRSAKRLAEVMAKKGQLLRDNALAALEENEQSDLQGQYQAFKEVLIYDLSKKDFADMYAQTLVYGLFVARYFDDSLENFSRYEAHELLPPANILLKKFFGHVAGADFDQKIAWIVDSLIEAYKGADVKALMHKEFTQKQKDPILHFYETFLSEYDEGLRKSRGVYYTPDAVASFIVRSVDEILKRDFNLPKGLADTTQIEHEFKAQQGDGRTKDGLKKIKEQIHKVQILDPATGTGTFLNEVIHEIYKTFKGQEGQWQGYVRDHLLPRLHGFELMMASYTMAHLKLGVTLKELGFDQKNERLSVWLTNSLEQSVHEVPNLFMSQWLTDESNQAAKIKSDLPIMVVLGNPPYSVSSSNKGEWIQNLIKDYKKDLGEKKINLDDDYIKFIRYAEHFIEENGSGVVAMITNNSFIDGITHRQMRKHLLETFDDIYILDLHGNSKKKEKSPDGSKDENVFSIMQGVSVSICVRKEGEKSGLGNVYHSELFGKQEAKFEALNQSSLGGIKWNRLKYSEPYYFFTPKDFGDIQEYEKGIKVDELFTKSGSGIITRNDEVAVQFEKQSIESLVDDFKNLSEEGLRERYGIKDGVSWKLKSAKEDVVDNVSSNKISEVLYRPFDFRYTLFTHKSGGFLNRPVFATMRYMVSENIALNTARIVPPNQDWNRIMVSNTITDIHSVSDQTYVFPLYLYTSDESKVSNLKKEIVGEIEKAVGETKPEDIFDYIYAVLHSPSYREKYKEFLKIDFPRVPYPKNKDQFWQLVGKGRELRGIHLLESPKVNEFVTTYSVGGENEIEKPVYKDGNVYINKEQYFGNVPEVAWNFYIGGYQPAQKWLKDRKGRKLSPDDLNHYQKIIVALVETDRIMGEINHI